MLRHKLINQINQLQDTFSPIDKKKPVLISAQSDTVKTSAQLVDCDRLGYLFNAVDAERIDASVVLDQTQIEEAIGAFLGRLTYLTEELILVEKTKDLSRVTLRSTAPDRREDGIYYYELMMEAGKSVHLERRCYDLKTRRQKAVPFMLSKEVSKRLFDDFEHILCGNVAPVEPSEVFSMEREEVLATYL